MGLVDYGSDSSDEESTATAIPGSTAPPVEAPRKSLFAALPAPKNRRGERKKIVLEVPATQPDSKDELSAAFELPAREDKSTSRSGSGLSSLLPAPKASTKHTEIIAAQAPSSSGNGPSLMTRPDDAVVVSGSNTLFKPKSIQPSIKRAKLTSTASTTNSLSKDVTMKPKVSLFSISSSDVYRRDLKTNTIDSGGNYEPMLATESRPRPDPDAKVNYSEKQEELVSIHPSEHYRYDPTIDYANANHIENKSTTEEPTKRRRRGDFDQESVSMREYDASEEYASNQAFIDSGAGTDEAAPVRFVGSGKHQLSSLLSLAHSQKDALEESFASQKRAMREGKNKYGR